MRDSGWIGTAETCAKSKDPTINRSLRDLDFPHPPSLPDSRTTQPPLDRNIPAPYFRACAYGEHQTQDRFVFGMTQPTSVAVGMDGQVNDDVGLRTRRRVGRACDHCNQSRRKCDGGRPCGYCSSECFRRVHLFDSPILTV